MPAPLWLARLSSAVLFGVSVLFAGAASAETIEVTDLAGRVVNVTRDPQKIALSEGRQLFDGMPIRRVSLFVHFELFHLIYHARCHHVPAFPAAHRSMGLRVIHPVNIVVEESTPFGEPSRL